MTTHRYSLMPQIAFNLISLIIVTVLPSCTSVPEPNAHQMITGISGPEDVIIDFSTPQKSLLVSSTDRRRKHSPGAIYRCFPSAKKPQKLHREGDSKHVISFNPHGIDLVQGTDGINRLYVVSHPQPTSLCGQIIVYRMIGNKLIFESCPSTYDYRGSIKTPNDIVATPDGKIYVTNFYNRSISYYNPSTGINGEWKTLKTGMFATNGVYLHDKAIYCAGYAGKVVKIDINADGSHSRPAPVTCLRGALDNFNPDPDFKTNSQVLITSHKSLIRFFLHALNPHFSSPTRIYSFPLNNPGKATEIRMANAKPIPISGGSSVSIIEGDLYVGQAIDNHILRIRNAEWRHFPNN